MECDLRKELLVMGNDLISRKELLDKMGWLRLTDEEADGILHCMKIVKEFPAVDAAPVVHGRWEHEVDWYDNGFTYIDMVFHRCSECGFKTNWRDKYDDRHKTLYNYCPRCGAKMDGE